VSLAVESNSDDVVLVQAAREEMCSMFIPKNDFQHQQMRPIIKRVTYRSKSQWHVHSDEEADRLVTTFVEEVDLVRDDSYKDIDLVAMLHDLLGKVLDVVNMSLECTEPARFVFSAVQMETLR
jgi:hypothetical protein